MKSQSIDHSAIRQLIVDNMKKEIYLMREVLNNMHLEEKALAIFDRCSWNQTLEQRFGLVQKLKVLRQDREAKIELIKEEKAGIDKRQNLPIEKILPTSDEESCEIVYLSDQLLALIEKTNAQIVKNEILMKRYLLHQGPISSYTSVINAEESRMKKKPIKTSIATYPPKET